MFEKSQPITAGRQNGVDRCTQVSSVCQNANAIANADAQRAAAVAAIANSALSGNYTDAVIVGATTLECGDGSVTGVASRGGNISCDDKLAGQRANKDAMAIALEVQKQVAGQNIHVQVVNSSGVNVSTGGTGCVSGPYVICVFATGAGNLTGDTRGDSYVTSTPPRVPQMIQTIPVDNQPPANQPPANQPPANQPPANQPPVFQPPVFQPPVIQPPVIQPQSPTPQPPKPVRPS